ncbi:MAG: hypothetical protein AAFZ07_10145 [Actinomycetota bacterium]
MTTPVDRARRAEDDDVVRQRLRDLRHEVLALDQWLSALVPLSARAKTLGINAALSATRHGVAGQPFGVVATQLADVTTELRLVGTEVRDEFTEVSRRLAAMSRNEKRRRLHRRAADLAGAAELEITEIDAVRAAVDADLHSVVADLRTTTQRLVGRVRTLRSDAEVIMAGLGVSARIEAVRLSDDVVASAAAIQTLVEEVRAVVGNAEAAASGLLPRLAEIDLRAGRTRRPATTQPPGR